MEKVKCIGCGSIIQTKDESRPGYVDKRIVDEARDGYLCKRCFNLRYHNLNNRIEINDIDNSEIFNEINDSCGLVIHVCDAFDFLGTIIPHINKLFPRSKIILVLNKSDLFIKDLNLNKLLSYVREYLKQADIHVSKILLTSAKNDDGILELIETLKELKGKRNCYFVGMSNVGKSKIINRIIYSYTNEDNTITVSNNLNTTLSSIYIPLDEDSYIVDTPGVINHNNLLYYLDDETIKTIGVKTYVKPINYQLNPSQSLFISGFLRVDFLEGEKSTFTCYYDRDIVIHRTKLENADDFFKNHKIDILKYPSLKEIKSLGNFAYKEVEVHEGEKIDIVLAGLGFMSVSGNAKIKITYYSKIKLSIRKAVF